MASISAALRSIKCELEQILPESIIADQARAAGHHWRERKLTPAITVHLCLLQLLARWRWPGCGTCRASASAPRHSARPNSACP
jgi:hypothetical protein